MGMLLVTAGHSCPTVMRFMGYCSDGQDHFLNLLILTVSFQFLLNSNTCGKNNSHFLLLPAPQVTFDMAIDGLHLLLPSIYCPWHFLLTPAILLPSFFSILMKTSSVILFPSPLLSVYQEYLQNLERCFA